MSSVCPFGICSWPSNRSTQYEGRRVVLEVTPLKLPPDWEFANLPPHQIHSVSGANSLHFVFAKAQWDHEWRIALSPSNWTAARGQLAQDLARILVLRVCWAIQLSDQLLWGGAPSVFELWLLNGLLWGCADGHRQLHPPGTHRANPPPCRESQPKFKLDLPPRLELNHMH